MFPGQTLVQSISSNNGVMPPVLIVHQVHRAARDGDDAVGQGAERDVVARPGRGGLQLQRPFLSDVDVHEEVERLRDDRLGRPGVLP